jgi:hypothetical protein
MPFGLSFDRTVHHNNGVLSLDVSEARKVSGHRFSMIPSIFNRSSSAALEAPKQQLLTIRYGAKDLTTSRLKACYLKNKGSSSKSKQIFGAKAEIELDKAIDNLRERALGKNGASFKTLEQMGLIKKAASTVSSKLSH